MDFSWFPLMSLNKLKLISEIHFGSLKQAVDFPTDEFSICFCFCSPLCDAATACWCCSGLMDCFQCPCCFYSHGCRHIWWRRSPLKDGWNSKSLQSHVGSASSHPNSSCSTGASFSIKGVQRRSELSENTPVRLRTWNPRDPAASQDRQAAVNAPLGCVTAARSQRKVTGRVFTSADIKVCDKYLRPLWSSVHTLLLYTLCFIPAWRCMVRVKAIIALVCTSYQQSVKFCVLKMSMTLSSLIFSASS